MMLIRASVYGVIALSVAAVGLGRMVAPDGSRREGWSVLRRCS